MSETHQSETKISSSKHSVATSSKHTGMAASQQQMSLHTGQSQSAASENMEESAIINKPSMSEVGDQLNDPLEESADVSKVNLMYGVMDNGMGQQDQGTD